MPKTKRPRIPSTPKTPVGTGPKKYGTAAKPRARAGTQATPTRRRKRKEELLGPYRPHRPRTPKKKKTRNSYNG